MEPPSILFWDKNYRNKLEKIEREPDFFSDLNLDRLVQAITGGKGNYLKNYFYLPLKDKKQVLLRQEIMRNLEDKGLRQRIKKFSQKMEAIRRDLEMMEKVDFRYHREGYFLEAVLLYIKACLSLREDLHQDWLVARGLKDFRDYLDYYLTSPFFLSLKDRALHVKEMLSKITYSIRISTNGFKVDAYQGEIEYTQEVERLFEKFRRDETQRHLFKRYVPNKFMNHIEEKILEFVARLFPEPFEEMDKLFKDFMEFLDGGIEQFDREIKFYLSYLDFVNKLARKGKVSFCYPEVSSSREVSIYGGFDVVLAYSRAKTGEDIVVNDLCLKQRERIIVVTGPNQGGKTTFARMFGQVHHLARLGLVVPAKRARVFLCDQILTHFERREAITNFQGKLEEELIRVHRMFSCATSRSIFILNEMFASTTLEDALFLNKEILNRISQMDALALCVTFIDELSVLNEKTVSMVAQVLAEDPTIRTFKIVRRQAHGKAYALSLAHKYGLTYKQIKERIADEGLFNVSQ